MDARPKRETRPTGTKTPIAGREARMHERKTLAGQGEHAPPGTSTALKRRLYLGRPEKGAAADWETRLEALEAAAERRSPCRQRRKSPSARRNSRRAGAVGQKRGFAALSAAERQGERANRQHARRDAPGESARKFPPQRRRQARRAKARSPCRQRRTPGRTPQQRDRRRMREERTGARPKLQAHTSAPRYFRAATSRSGNDARHTHKRGDALNAARRCGRL